MIARVAIYARVSTPNQTQAQTIDQQLERLQAYVQSNSPEWQLAEDHIFRDDGHSGATLRRPGLDRLRDAVRLGEVDRLLVATPDRLARNYVHQPAPADQLRHH